MRSGRRLARSHAPKARRRVGPLVAAAAGMAGVGGGAAPLVAQQVAETRASLCMVPDSLGLQLERITRRVGGATGVAAIHVESGARVSWNGDQRFPMASVSKIPMALQLLRLVDEGRIDLEDEVRVTPADFRAGNSPLAERARNRPVTVTVDSLLWLMIGVSDNSATDVLLGMAGGPREVTRRLRELGIETIDVDRSEARTFADLAGIPDTVPESELSRTAFFRKRDRLPEGHRRAARERYGEDPRDTATPDGMAELLRVWFLGGALAPGSREVLLNYMTRSRSGPRRMRGLLPPGTPVAHKTGTLAGAVNDVGLVTLPDGAGHLIIAAFVNTLNHTTWRRERTIAEVTRLLHDHFAAEGPALAASPVVAGCALARDGRFWGPRAPAAPAATARRAF